MSPEILSPDVPVAPKHETVGVWQRIKRIGQAGAAMVAITIGAEGVRAGPPAKDAPMTEEKKEKLVPLTYEQVKKLRDDLGDEIFRVRATAKTELEKHIDDPHIAEFLSPALDDEETSLDRRYTVKPLVQKSLDKNIPLQYEIQLSAIGWIDGMSYNRNLEALKKFNEFRVEFEGETLKPLVSYYRAQAQLHGAPCDNSPKWTDYAVGLELYLKECRDRSATGKIWNQDKKKRFDEWSKKNPTGDQGWWLVNDFEKEMTDVIRKITTTGEEFVTGSEEYRKTAKLPLLRPPPGPDVNFEGEDFIAFSDDPAPAAAPDFGEIELLIPQMESEDFELREKAYAALKQVKGRALFYLTPGLRAEDTETRKRVEELLAALPKVVEKELPIPPSAKGKDHFWTTDKNVIKTFLHRTPSGALKDYDRILSQYGLEAERAGASRSPNRDYEHMKKVLERVATEKRDQEFEEAIRWSDDDKEAQAEWQKANPTGDVADWRKKRFDWKLERVTERTYSHIEPFIKASQKWRESSEEEKSRGGAPTVEPVPVPKKMLPRD